MDNLEEEEQKTFKGPIHNIVFLQYTVNACYMCWCDAVPFLLNGNPTYLIDGCKL